MCKIVGKSTFIKQILNKISKVAKGNSPVLVTGESGTGKELIAKIIHLQSDRREKPFVTVSCPNLSESLLESELFGYEKVGITNTTEKKIGRLEMANGGTIFLDEISGMSLANQSKLLRFLQEFEFIRVGGTRLESVNVRLIASTNVNIKKAIDKGMFRKDLYFRINVVPIEIPPLRKRREDIPLLIKYYFEQYKKNLNVRVRRINKEAMELLKSYSWPGNVRELKNVIELILTLYGDKTFLQIHHLPDEIRSFDSSFTTFDSIEPPGEESLDYAVAQLEKKLIKMALKKANGKQIGAAYILKTTRRKLKYKMDKLGISHG